MKLKDEVDMLRRNLDKIIRTREYTFEGFTWNKILKELKELVKTLPEKNVAAVHITPGAFQVDFWKEFDTKKKTKKHRKKVI